MPYYYAPCALGIESILAAEVRAAGGNSIREERGGVSFAGKPRVAMTLCLWSRVASRVLEELAHRRCRSADELYDLVRTVNWSKMIGPDQTLAVRATLRTPHFNHSTFAAQRVKDGVVDHVRDATGQRPSVDLEDPDLPLKLVIRGEHATLARDLAGLSLHKRGYRPIQVKSPINEALAAGLILLTGWDGKQALCDPMCGSGTFLIEAAHIAADRAPGLRREFAFQRWPDFDRRTWKKLLSDADQRWLDGKKQVGPLIGNDRHEGALEIARKSAILAEVDHLITFNCADVDAFEPETTPEVVVCNPPFGVRIGEGDDLVQSWSSLATFFKRQCPGASAWVLSGDPELSKALRLKTNRRIPVHNGSIECRWLRYDIRSVLDELF